LQLPTQFGPYLLLERVSVGGMAEVFKAKEYGVEGFERTVAVKRILPHVAEDEEFIAMFKDEAKIAVQLTHGNIAQIYSLGNERDSFYIALEYVAGRDLRAMFQKCQQLGAPMPIAQSCYVIMKICEGLDYAHNKKDTFQRELHIVHRDVSPPNILVSFEGEVKLIDFGVAKAAGRASRTQAGILKGKFGYMSPEQVRGMPLDRRSDVFAMGVVIFEILTGQRLFQAETDFATLEKVRAVDVPRPTSINPQIPDALERIMYQALAREPSQRYSSAMELHDALQAFMFAQGLFYSRKDLAAWMHTNYAAELDLEKEKDKAHASLRPETLAGGFSTSGSDGLDADARRERRTMMMPTGGPQASPVAKGAAIPAGSAKVSPRPRAEAEGGSSRPSGAGQPQEKRKTMVMVPSRPSGLPGPAASDEARSSDPSGGPPMPSPRPRPGMGAGDFDWEDDELETRLFDNDGSRPTDELLPAGPGRSIAPSSGAPWSVPPSGGPSAGYPSNSIQGMDGPGPAANRSNRRPVIDHHRERSVVRSSSAGPLIAILVTIIVVLSAGFVGYVLLRDRVEGPVTRTSEPPVQAPVRTSETLSMNRATKVGAMTLEITPPTATVTVDGKPIEGRSPFRVADLEVGTHAVSIAQDGYIPIERDIAVSSSPLSLEFNLQRREVALVFETVPPGATVQLVVDGKVGPISLGPDRRYPLARSPESTYGAEISHPGFITQRVPVEFTGSAEQVIRTVLAQDPAATVEGAEAGSPEGEGEGAATGERRGSKRPRGRGARTAILRIGTDAGVPPAQVFIDGKLVGKTPRPEVLVTPGRHTVTYRWPDGREVKKTITVADGGVEVVKGG